MKVLLAPDKFKGSLTAAEVASHLGTGLRARGFTVDELPLADGGDGSVAAAVAAGFAPEPVTVAAPATGRPHTTEIALSTTTDQDMPTAVVEVANTCGLHTLPGGRLAPLAATSAGVGQAVRHAVEHGARRIVLALGGSASTDGGAGLLAALGAGFRDRGGDMDARQLKFFLAVIDYGGFSRAAEQLFIAQPSLSQTIAGLERELGVPLFHRVGRGVVPSDAAQRLVGPARQVMRDLANAQSAIDAVKGITTGQVEIISMPSPAVEPLTSIMTGFVGEHPDISLSVAAAFEPDEVLHAVRTGEVEIGLLGAPTAVKAADLRVLPIEDQELVLITGPDGPLAGVDTITPTDLTGHGLIVAPKGSLMRGIVDDVLSSGVRAKVIAEVAHRTSILPLVLAGVADAVMPAGWSSLARSAGGRVIRIQPPSHLHVALVTRKAALTPASHAFVLATESYVAGSCSR